MTAQEFRDLALVLPEAVDAEHMGHPDFRVRKKIFATLGPGESWGMVKLTPDEQAELIRVEPEAFQPFPGLGAGRCTRVVPEFAGAIAVRQALIAA